MVVALSVVLATSPILFPAVTAQAVALLVSGDGIGGHGHNYMARAHGICARRLLHVEIYLVAAALVYASLAGGRLPCWPPGRLGIASRHQLSAQG